MKTLNVTETMAISGGCKHNHYDIHYTHSESSTNSNTETTQWTITQNGVTTGNGQVTVRNDSKQNSLLLKICFHFS